VSTAEPLSVTTRFYGLFVDVVGSSRVEIALFRGATVADLLHVLKDRYGERFWQRVMEDPTRISRFVELIVNGRQVDRSALDTPLASEDGGQLSVINVLILPPTAGGC